QRIFVLQSTLGLLEELVAKLDRLPPAAAADRQFSLFFYRGFATRFENERITADIRDRLPAYVNPVDSPAHEPWHSEAEWIEIVGDEDAPGHDIHLKLFLTEDNIGRLEATSCESIVEQMTARTLAAYDRIPSRAELCEKYGDRGNSRLYHD